MVEFRDPKNQILIIIVAVFLVLIYVWHAKFFTPYASELAVKKVQHQQLQSELFSVKQKAKSLDALQEEYSNLFNRYEKVKLWLPEKKEDESFLAQLHIAAQLTNSQIVSVMPKEPDKKEFYDANIYEIGVEASYHGLGSFFAKVVNFPFIVTISDVSMLSSQGESLAESDQKTKEHTVYSQFLLTTYNSHSGGQTQ